MDSLTPNSLFKASAVSKVYSIRVVARHGGVCPQDSQNTEPPGQADKASNHWRGPGTPGLPTSALRTSVPAPAIALHLKGAGTVQESYSCFTGDVNFWWGHGWTDQQVKGHLMPLHPPPNPINLLYIVLNQFCYLSTTPQMVHTCSAQLQKCIFI